LLTHLCQQPRPLVTRILEYFIDLKIFTVYNIDVYLRCRSGGKQQMKRTQVYLEDFQKKVLEQLAEQKNVSMGEMVREAINKYIADNHIEVAITNINNTCGLWSERNDMQNSDEWVRSLRNEWYSRADFRENEK